MLRIHRRAMAKVVSPIVYDDFEPEMFHDEEGRYAISNFEPDVQDQTERRTPEDKYNFVYIIFYLMGTTIMLPWFFFVTCNDYWMHRFRDLKNESNGFRLFLDMDFAANRSRLQADFTSYISIASTIPSTIFLFINVFYLRRLSVHWRIVSSTAVILLCFMETTGLVLIDSDSWQIWFFIVTISTVVVLNMAAAILQAALCSIFMNFPIKYISAFSSGQSLGGIFASLALLATLYIDTTPTKTTFFYFLIANVTILIAFVCYLVVKETDFFLYYAEVIGEDGGSIQYRRLESERNAVLIDYYKIQKKILIPSAGLFFCYLVTASIYPSIAVLVCSVNVGVKSAWNEKYFVPVVTYLSYCICDYIGRIIAGIIQKPKGLWVLCFSLVRVGFIPLLMFCNAQPRHHLPVLIDADWLYISIIITLALSNGYLTTLTFVLIPERTYPHEQAVASMMIVTWLAASLSVGSLMSFLLINML